jgi:DNA-binding NtrC family response regulator
LKALEQTHWNRKRAARELQISYKSLLNKIKQIGVGVSDSEEL